jgi:DNA polymerase I-like protein with 3'-5' exonuclease and polymerase domains
MAETILRDSWEAGDGKLAEVTAAQCKRLQNLYFARYPGVRRWQERVRMLLQRDGKLTSAADVPRDFFGPKKDHATQKEAYAHCPAFNTAYANNLALLKLWQDPDNIDAAGKRIFRPLITVHDAIVGQAPQDRRDWVLAKIPVWWANELEVAGMRFTLGYEAKIGPSWGDLHSL